MLKNCLVYTSSNNYKNCSVQNYIYFEKSQKARSQGRAQGRAQGHAQVCARVNQLLLRRVITLQFSPGHPLYEKILQKTRTKNRRISSMQTCFTQQDARRADSISAGTPSI